MSRKALQSESLLSIADISRRFTLPESTTRYYCKRFATFIPSVGEGRRRRYRPETLEVIAAILDQMQRSRTAVAVEEVLQSRFPSNVPAVADTTALTESSQPSRSDFFSAAALQLMERQTQALEGISHVLRLCVERLPQAQAEPEESMQLRKDVEALRILLDSSEKTQQADLDQLRRWMGRVIQTRSLQPEA